MTRMFRPVRQVAVAADSVVTVALRLHLRSAFTIFDHSILQKLT